MTTRPSNTGKVIQLMQLPMKQKVIYSNMPVKVKRLIRLFLPHGFFPGIFFVVDA